MATDSDSALEHTLAAVGPRLRSFREQRRSTLADVARSSGISVSTLSRLETGSRRPTLELLLRLARTYDVPVDDLLTAASTTDPRVRRTPVHRGGRTIIPLTNRPGDVLAHKMIIEPSNEVPDQRTHAGFEWIYVLAGRLRLRLGELDLVLRSGEVAEFDTRTPHWFGGVGVRPAEVLVLFSPQGERMHVRARSRPPISRGSPDRDQVRGRARSTRG